ncbi:hypothetical protein CVG87_00165 [Pseudomonas sp. WCS365]|nr:hypothetical protein CVG87_00165 [Pseudomonas sp. WCS365]
MDYWKVRYFWTSKFIETGSISIHATKDHAEVCPVSRGIMFQSLSEPLQPGVRFLCDPIPAQPTVHLAVCLPEGSHTGLPRSLTVTRLV